LTFASLPAIFSHYLTFFQFLFALLILSRSLTQIKTQNPEESEGSMGIKDLLRFVKPYIEPIHIKRYAGKRVNILTLFPLFFFESGIFFKDFILVNLKKKKKSFLQVGIDAYSWLHKGGR
jgi:hypothetical protein